MIINCCNPTYEEAFDYIVPERDVAGCKLVITVKTKKWFNSPVLGQVNKYLNSITSIKMFGFRLQLT